MKAFYLTAGVIATGLGVLGIFLPLLPTTPLLLLAAFCFARSSQRIHNWLLNHPVLGAYIRDYLEKRAIRLKVKITAIMLIWVSIGTCILFVVEGPYLQLLLLIIAGGVSLYILSLKTLRE